MGGIELLRTTEHLKNKYAGMCIKITLQTLPFFRMYFTFKNINQELVRKQLQICTYACFLYCLTLIGCRAAHNGYVNNPASSDASNDNAAKPIAKTKNKGNKQYNELYRKSIAVVQPPVTDKQPAAKARDTQSPFTTALAVNTAHDTTDNKEVAKTTASKKEAQTKDIIQQDEANERTQPLAEEPTPLLLSEADSLVLKYADLINVEHGKLTNYPLYQFIDDWYGTRYKWGGMDNSGIDCSAFSQKLYDEVFGLELERTSRQQHRQSTRIKDIDKATEGDLIFFRIHRLAISHVGVYLANGYFVHASRSRGVVISSLNNKYWSRRYAGCGRMVRDEGASVTEMLAP